MRPGLFVLLLALAGCADKTPPTWAGDATLRVEATATAATLRWPAATDDDALASYRVLQDDVEIATVPEGPSEHVGEGLRDATEYRFSVQPLDVAGNRGELLHERATTADGTPPTWPSGARLLATPRTALPADAPEGTEPTVVATTLRWVAAEDPSGVSGYRLVAGASTLAELGEVTSHELEGAAPEGLAVVAVDAAGNVSARLVARAAAEGEAPEVAEAPSEVSSDTENTQVGTPTVSPISPQVREALGRVRIRPEILKLRPELAPRLNLRQVGNTPPTNPQ